MSPRFDAQRLAVVGCISTHDCQSIFVTGSGQLLQPGLVGAAAVADDGARGRRRGTSRRPPAVPGSPARPGRTRRRRGRRGRLHRAGDEPLRERGGQGGRAARGSAPSATRGSPSAGSARPWSGPSRASAMSTSAVARVPEHRIHRRLLQRHLPLPGLRVAPALEAVVVREDQVAQLRRLVGVDREADLERHLRERRGEAERRRAASTPGWRRARMRRGTCPASSARPRRTSP